MKVLALGLSLGFRLEGLSFWIVFHELPSMGGNSQCGRGRQATTTYSTGRPVLQAVFGSLAFLEISRTLAYDLTISLVSRTVIMIRTIVITIVETMNS